MIEVVRAVGIEPTLLAEPDFESGASTSSTTPASEAVIAHPRRRRKGVCTAVMPSLYQRPA